jgi:hypothetical protein
LYGDSQGSPAQDSHFDPLEAQAQPVEAQHTNILAPMDVKVAGPETGQPAWSTQEPAPARGSSLPGGVVKFGIVAGAAVVVIGGGAVGALALTSGSDGKAAAVVTPTTSVLADRGKASPDPQAVDDATRKLLLERASRAARGDAKDAPALTAKGASPSPTASSGGAPSAGNPMPSGQAQTLAKSMMSAKGWSPSTQFGCLVNLWNKESGWRVTAGNPSGAYGIPQALPGTKMASAGSDWKTSAKTQITWGFGYIKDRYGTPCAAWSHWQSSNWY